MHTKRIIPCLDVNNNRVVKGTNFVNLRDAGDPVEVAKAYNKAGADELVFLDIPAATIFTSLSVNGNYNALTSKLVSRFTYKIRIHNS